MAPDVRDPYRGGAGALGGIYNAGRIGKVLLRMLMKIDLSGKAGGGDGGEWGVGAGDGKDAGGCGADVAISYLKGKEKAEMVLKEVQAMGRRAVAVQADVTDLGSVMKLRDKVGATLGDAEIIVNNAVVQYQGLSVMEQATEDFESQFRSCVSRTCLWRRRLCRRW